MATDIVLRSIKAAALTHAEMDQNWESLAQTVDAILANYTVLVTDQNKILECDIASGTITLLTLSDAAGTDTDSFRLIIKNTNATNLTIAANGFDTIEGAATVQIRTNETISLSLAGDASLWMVTGYYNTSTIGLTASAAELNTLDGIITTTTELNHSSGVTSPIQTQLNNKQPFDADLTAIAALPNADSNFIVGNGSTWVAETGATARSSMGVDAAGTDNSTDVSLAGAPNYITIAGQVITRALISLTTHITGILPLANGGTASSTASGARTSLGVDAAGTDNSTNVSLVGTPNYLTIAGQVITRSLINLTTHVTGALPYANMNFSNNIVATDIAAGAVGSSEIATDAVGPDELAPASVGRAQISTAVVSLSGTLSITTSGTNIILTAYSFFPMIRVSVTDIQSNGFKAVPYLTGHLIDGGADGPRFRFGTADTKSTTTYDVKYRYIMA